MADETSNTIPTDDLVKPGYHERLIIEIDRRDPDLMSLVIISRALLGHSKATVDLAGENENENQNDNSFSSDSGSTSTDRGSSTEASSPSQSPAGSASSSSSSSTSTSTKANGTNNAGLQGRGSGSRSGSGSPGNREPRRRPAQMNALSPAKSPLRPSRPLAKRRRNGQLNFSRKRPRLSVSVSSSSSSSEESD